MAKIRLFTADITDKKKSLPAYFHLGLFPLQEVLFGPKNGMLTGLSRSGFGQYPACSQALIG